MKLVPRRRRSLPNAVLLAGLLLAWSPCAFALNPALDVSQYAHMSWRIREGFTKGVIVSMAQTPDGYLWLGTEHGLVRFDGVRAVPWQPPSNQHLPSSEIDRLLAALGGSAGRRVTMETGFSPNSIRCRTRTRISASGLSLKAMMARS